MRYHPARNPKTSASGTESIVVPMCASQNGNAGMHDQKPGGCDCCAIAVCNARGHLAKVYTNERRPPNGRLGKPSAAQSARAFTSRLEAEELFARNAPAAARGLPWCDAVVVCPTLQAVTDETRALHIGATQAR